MARPRVIARPSRVCDPAAKSTIRGQEHDQETGCIGRSRRLDDRRRVVGQGTDWPSQPIRLVVPYVAGGSTDTAARIVAEKLSGMLGQQVIVENKGGGNTIIGMDVVAKAKPDGNTLLLGAATMATNVALASSSRSIRSRISR